MANARASAMTRWMVTPLEIVAVVALVALTVGGLYVSVQDALQLEQALNLNLTQTLLVTQGIVNLQREVLLTQNEVVRLLGRLDDPPKPVTRFAFVKIQVSNLATEIQSSQTRAIFATEDLTLVQEIQLQSAALELRLANWQSAGSPEQQATALRTIETQLDMLEATVKQLIDRQATAQREAITQTRNSLGVSQRTSLLAGGALLLMAIALAFVVRQGLNSRLQQAVQADRMKSQLLANVSHELRTPINAIQGYSQLLSEEAYGSLSGEQQTTIRRILLNTTQLQGMVNNLLDSAQIEQGKLAVRNTSFLPSDLLESTRSALSILAETKGVALTSEISRGVPIKLVGDSLRLQQILFNLISNALKFTETGSVRVRIFMPNPAHWALQVIDTGIGIAPEAQARVFAPFWQVDSSATRQYRGSGLGLSIVKQLADLMGGQISLDSQPGKGSTFTIIFPMIEAN